MKPRAWRNAWSTSRACTGHSSAEGRRAEDFALGSASEGHAVVRRIVDQPIAGEGRAAPRGAYREILPPLLRTHAHQALQPACFPAVHHLVHVGPVHGTVHAAEVGIA